MDHGTTAVPTAIIGQDMLHSESLLLIKSYLKPERMEIGTVGLWDISCRTGRTWWSPSSPGGCISLELGFINTILIISLDIRYK